ncbi:class I adenylate-forming enzyme family protein [Sphingobium sp. SCG-1]|uniref:class I adenylate-forming enzyme family protein n=1 Tax=Sphingobium sp. SCG-1 TaxID=2072936 RepID=UPI0011AB41E5|nr:class I adenylate-forming enzyme family protein [Sphingobium sp. SCG-1]
MKKTTSRTLSSLIEELAVNCGDRPAVSYQAETRSFAEFRDLARRCGKALHATGVKKGDTIGLLMGNSIEWLVVAMGAQYVGATLVALNTWYTDRELSYVMGHGDVTVLVTAARFLKSDYVPLLERLKPWEVSFPLLRQIVVSGGEPGEGMVSYETFLAGGDAISDAQLDELAAAVTPDDIAYILYTSGSTSHPKGVMLAHRGLIENMHAIGARLDFTEEDTLFLPVSLFWGMGCENGLFAAWTHATHIVLQHHFDVDEAIALMSQHRCTALYGTANIIQAIVDHPEREKYDLSRLEKGCTGGTPEQIRRIIETFMPKACHAYGMTETYGFMTVADGVQDSIAKRAESYGRPLPGMEIKVIDSETGQPLPVGETGEVRVRGYVMVGYYKAPEQTAAAVDADGYLITGDRGHFDDDGYFYFRGRIKEMLKTGGLNVSPLEVEEVLRAHANVEDAFVTGLPDKLREEIVAAVVVPKEGCTLSEPLLVEHCRSMLAAFKVPRRIVISQAKDVPLTTTGKVHKAKLAAMFPSEAAGS